MGFPYEYLRHSPYWATLEEGIEELVKNGDLRELTERDYVVGYLVKCLEEHVSESAGGDLNAG